MVIVREHTVRQASIAPWLIWSVRQVDGLRQTDWDALFSDVILCETFYI